ncbi:hypothetical protein Sru01_68880 [Sphaerisporangium rufum]|uniref:Anti-sigma K factor RskA C-terminal domain-containing protein n=1 Tax=Sphaerisporangium rufum TaxID=1381558 RepID=A0A919R935_9ACTN|nr:anti-sigma factor [Sphaerisporangium rufum]GII81906.1 hypothetical protein Sru01_68880 [Sphaerisporangium rufum]
MNHIDPEDLALLALGESIGGGDTAGPAPWDHLDSCRACAAELAELRAVVTTARSGPPRLEPVEPPGRVWERIAAELEPAPDATRGPDAPRPAAPGRSARRRRLLPVLTALAAGVAGVVVGASAVRVFDQERTPAETVARTALSALPRKPGQGTARVERSGGVTTLDLRVTGLPAAGGFYEVWLLDRKAAKLISLGALPPGGAGSFLVPSGVDLREYAVVDVSLEPFDGDPAHSSDSYVRGTLPG